MTTAMSFRRITLLAGFASLAACATTGTTGTGGTTAPAPGSPAAQPAQGWSVNAREHVDLWLHGYAMLQQDTARVPFFRRGYREQLLAERRSRNVTTALDVDRERLAARMTANPALVNGQFLAMYFASFEDLQRVVETTIRLQGDVRGAPDQQMAQYMALVNATFPTAADRDWLRTFMQAITGERRLFYRDYWAAEQSRRADARAAVAAAWSRYESGFRRFLQNTQQNRGELLLSLPLNGEGRTAQVASGFHMIGVTFPATAAAANEALYTFAHEAVLRLAGTAVDDNITPAEQRSGVGSAHTSNAAVRGGLLLIERVAPDLAAGYQRYYLASIGATVPSGTPQSAFVAAFPLPAAILSAIGSQLDVVMGGI
ncbi:MAG: hypothetical protein H0X64_13820 [Gemmatimonadaceae bacterium]|nr:hypothetical protein [Gemmatimonadaceae bacterium]